MVDLSNRFANCCTCLLALVSCFIAAACSVNSGYAAKDELCAARESITIVLIRDDNESAGFVEFSQHGHTFSVTTSEVSPRSNVKLLNFSIDAAAYLDFQSAILSIHDLHSDFVTGGKYKCIFIINRDGTTMHKRIFAAISPEAFGRAVHAHGRQDCWSRALMVPKFYWFREAEPIWREWGSSIELNDSEMSTFR